MAKPRLTNADFERAASRLRCEIAAIKAVAEVESRGEGFYSDGFPVILFERHIFRKYTQGRYNKSHPHLSGPAGGYGAAGANQRRKFNEAFALNPDAAMKSCSFGKFQIMGFNHAVCGFSTVGAFVDAMKVSEGEHLDAFVSFVIKNNLADELRRKDWAAFARGYNGPGYAKNRYDTKMAAAYKKYLKNSAAAPTVKPAITKPAKDDPAATDPQTGVAESGVKPQAPPPLDDQSVEIAHKQEFPTKEGGTESVEVTTKNEQGVNETIVQPGPVPYNDKGLRGTLIDDAKTVLPANGGLQMFSEYAQQATGWPEWVIGLIGKAALILLVVTIGWVLYRFISYILHNWRENERVKIMAMINTDINRKNIEFCEVVMKDRKSS